MDRELDLQNLVWYKVLLEIIAFCNGPTGSPSGKFSPEIL